MKKWNEWVAGDAMNREDCVRAIGEIAQGLMDGSIKGVPAGYKLETIRFNMMSEGERQDDYCDTLGALAKITPATAPALSGAQIRAIREKTGLNQFDFADKLGVSRDAVNSWECGRRKPGAAIRKILALIDGGSLDAKEL